MANENFPREYRIVTPENFDYVFKDPIRAASPCLTVLAKSSGLPFPRLGLIVPKKALKRAVWRNRVKRLIRENFRKSKQNLENIDIVIIAKNGINNLSNEELDLLVTKLCKTISHRYKKQVVS
ncbi:MAG: ribonuclease P protein component [Succinivibrionaceae bacterium]|nr:ribonuclease P protein component [Succinivibrionaceae bacterium]